MRTITLTDHPSNIAVFEAASMHDAVFKADEAIRRDGTEGAVWQKEPKPFDWNHEYLFLHNYRSQRRYLIEQASKEHFKEDYPAEKNIYAHRSIKDLFRHHVKIYPKEFDNLSLLDEERLENISALKIIFPNSTSLNIRYLLEGRTHCHFDGSIWDSRLYQDKLFFGKNLRILCTREGLGTVVYEEPHNPEKSWSVGSCSYLFFLRKNEGLHHSEPTFKIKKTYPRVLDIYDC